MPWLSEAEEKQLGAKEARSKFLQEAAFTTLNRLCALRMAEAREIVFESIGNGYHSKGFQLYTRVAGTALGEIGDAYRCYLFSLFDEFAVDLAVLFDRYSPMGRLFPRDSTLLNLIEEINDPEIAPLWSEDETIGWIYQYFNTVDERRKMRAESQAPRNSRELAVRNQFFTPRYVVEFLTDNTLGRIWYEMTKGATALKVLCRYLVRRPNEIFLAQGEEPPDRKPETGDWICEEEMTQEELLKQPVYIPHRPLKDPREIRMLDPACGSMHFGLYAFDLFERIYEEAWNMEESGQWSVASGQVRDAGVGPLHSEYPTKEVFLRDVPKLIIEHNIHGVDIDPRAVQIAGLSLWLRAQRAWKEQGVKPAERPRIVKSNVVCAEPMPGEKDLLREFSQKLKPRVLGQLLEIIFEKMELAGEAGSLLKIEEEIEDAVEQAREEFSKELLRRQAGEQQELFAAMERPKQQSLFDFADLPDKTGFWAKVEVEIQVALRDYAVYAEAGDGYRRRLFAEDAARGFAFIDICRKRFDVVLMNPPFGEPSQLSKQWMTNAYPTTKNDILGPFVERGILALNSGGAIGAITARTAFQLSSMASFRKELILKETTIRTFADLGGEVLDSAMVKTAAYALSKAREDVHSAFINLTDSQDKGLQLALEISDGLSGKNVFLVRQDEFHHIPGSPLAYWADNVVRRCFARLPALASLNVEVKQGLGTTDDFRFVRVAWEVPPALIGRRKHWPFYAKGGESNDFHSDIHLVVNWADGGREVYEHNGIPYGGAGAPIRNPGFYFKPGLTYTSYTNKGFSPRVLPSDCIFTTAGMGIFLADPLPMLSLLNSRVIQLFLLMITDERKWEVGYVRSIPIKKLDSTEKKHLSELSIRAWRKAVSSTLRDETQRLFNGFTGLHRISVLHTEDERLKHASQSLGDNLRRIRRQIDEQALALYGLTTQHIEFVDRRLGLGTDENPEVADISTGLASLLLGIAAGRWDIRYATSEKEPSELPYPFDPLPVCPPGMLQNTGGLPAAQEDVPDDYPLRISWPGILVDDEGHDEDIVARVREAMEVIWKEKAGDIEQEVCDILGVRFLRDYFVKPAKFFADHLKRYSKSRRQAPIYWPLSTPSGFYTLWIYYHRLTDQTLYTCINDFVEPKLSVVAGQLADIRRQRMNGNRGLEKEYERLTDLELELKDFRDELLRIARFWKPNLNDGVQITASPLWKLFLHKPWQKTLKETWKKLEKGDYDWAHLAYSIWPERVVGASHKDRSYAIAHDLEADLWEEIEVGKDGKGNPKTKWVPKDLSEAEIKKLAAEKCGGKA